ncbi:hypothetical protein NX774_12005 [Massilia agilis]|uniref:Uncharacterized protein n=1 Tax=Massilia agilis TaxID=1811226 RepID=A0ABT2DBY3_9BURK|nr:hypothetical protein [Massilia agilis]MCS0808643.1 hypothetical protein [Massilia agilis]
MRDWKRIPTSAEVAAVIRARHGKELVVFSSFSDPDGTFNGGAGVRGRMETAWGFSGADAPILEARTTWDIDIEQQYGRANEKHEYWLCAAKTDD